MMYEHWIAHPRKHAYVHVDDRQRYARQAGWWCVYQLVGAGDKARAVSRKYALEDLDQLGVSPEPRHRG